MAGLLKIIFAFGVPRLLEIFISEEKFFLKKLPFVIQQEGRVRNWGS